MKYFGKKIDHIVYCTHDLNASLDYFENELGVRPAIGGKHLTKGTKNALLNLGEACYFEILAIDHDNTKIKGPRWMGIDLITEPMITRWAIKSDDLAFEKDVLEKYNPNLGTFSKGERETQDGTILSWQMLLPIENPKIELAPFVLDWSQSEYHPTDQLKQECSLESIQFLKAKENEKIQLCFHELFPNSHLAEADKDQIKISIKGPKGTLYI